MKIEHPAVYALVGSLGARVVRLWTRSLRLRVVSEDPSAVPTVATRRHIYVLWHETLLMPISLFPRDGIRALVSRHRDGEYLARIIERLGYGLVRGSTTRGAVQALRELSRPDDRWHVAITPDGPRGPRQELKPGVVYIAAKSGMPIVPVGLAADRPWRLNSWDQFVLPRPFSRVACYGGRPIDVPADLDDSRRGEFEALLASEMSRVTLEAETLLANRAAA